MACMWRRRSEERILQCGFQFGWIWRGFWRAPSFPRVATRRRMRSVFQAEVQQMREPDQPQADQARKSNQRVVNSGPPPALRRTNRHQKIPDRQNRAEHAEPADDLNCTEPGIGARGEQVEVRPG